MAGEANEVLKYYRKPEDFANKDPFGIVESHKDHLCAHPSRESEGKVYMKLSDEELSTLTSRGNDEFGNFPRNESKRKIWIITYGDMYANGILSRPQPESNFGYTFDIGVQNQARNYPGWSVKLDELEIANTLIHEKKMQFVQDFRQETQCQFTTEEVYQELLKQFRADCELFDKALTDGTEPPLPERPKWQGVRPDAEVGYGRKRWTRSVVDFKFEG